MSRENNRIYEFDSFQLDPANRRLLKDGEPIPLKPKVFSTLVVLVENSKNVVSKDDLMNKVWPDTHVQEDNLTQNISVLRRALGNDSQGKQYIETVPKLGYRFVADVKEVQFDKNEPEAVTESQKYKYNFNIVLLGIGAILLCLVIVKAYQWSATEITPHIESVELLSGPTPARDDRFELSVQIKGSGFNPDIIRVVLTGEGCRKYGSCEVKNPDLFNHGSVTSTQIERVPLTLKPGDFELSVQNGVSGPRSDPWPLTVLGGDTNR
jgi:DNA-binding winged helix-turn-helix (wHTH) protein